MSQKHDLIKLWAVEWLRNMGYQDIRQEFRVAAGKGWRGKVKKFSVDVVGIKYKFKIAIECGGSPPEKLNRLTELFNAVWVLPYGGGLPYLWRPGMQCCKNCGHII